MRRFEAEYLDWHGIAERAGGDRLPAGDGCAAAGAGALRWRGPEAAAADRMGEIVLAMERAAQRALAEVRKGGCAGARCRREAALERRKPAGFHEAVEPVAGGAGFGVSFGIGAVLGSLAVAPQHLNQLDTSLASGLCWVCRR